MNNIKTNELKELRGGAISGWAAAAIAAAVTFISGFLDGIARPSRCN